MKVLIGIALATGLCLSAASTAFGAATSTSTHLSSKHRKHHAAVAAPVAASPYPVWNGPDPTKGPGIAQLRELQREGACVIDEGYGRYTYCGNQ